MKEKASQIRRLPKYVFFPLFIQRKAICCVYLFLTFEDFLRPANGAEKQAYLKESVLC